MTDLEEEVETVQVEEMEVEVVEVEMEEEEAIKIDTSWQKKKHFDTPLASRIMSS